MVAHKEVFFVRQNPAYVPSLSFIPIALQPMRILPTQTQSAPDYDELDPPPPELLLTATISLLSLGIIGIGTSISHYQRSESALIGASAIGITLIATRLIVCLLKQITFTEWENQTKKNLTTVSELNCHAAAPAA